MLMAPPLPSPTSTMASEACPAVGLTFDVPEYDPPAGKTARNVEVDTLVTVRLNTTPVAFAGIPLRPATVQVSVSCDGDKWYAGVRRLSRTRTGVIGVNAFWTGPGPAWTDHGCDIARASGRQKMNPTVNRRRLTTTFRSRRFGTGGLHATGRDPSGGRYYMHVLRRRPYGGAPSPVVVARSWDDTSDDDVKCSVQKPVRVSSRAA